MRFALIAACGLALSSITLTGWVSYEPLRDTPDYGPVVTDVERHLPAKHGFRASDKISWTHEGTHGIAGQLRSKYQQPGFYLLDDKAFTLAQPKTTIAATARLVPESFQGSIYKNYCVDARAYWNNEPSYLIDEWVAYLNGARARKALNIENRTEAVRYLVDIAICATCIPRTLDYEDADLKLLLRYLWEETLLLVGDDYPSVAELRTNPDCTELYTWMKEYFGASWVTSQFEDKPDYNIWDKND